MILEYFTVFELVETFAKTSKVLRQLILNKRVSTQTLLKINLYGRTISEEKISNGEQLYCKWIGGENVKLMAKISHNI